MSNTTNEKIHDCYAKNELYSLNYVIGLGIKNNYSISQNSINGLLTWITGPYLIFYDFEKSKQIGFLKNINNKILNCVSFSKNGKFVVTGEGNCKNGEVSIYEINYDKNKQEETHTLYSSYKYHKYGIEKIIFFNNDNYLLSIGDKDDKNINIYDIKNKKIISNTKYNRPILSCDACDKFMVLCGDKFIKIYNYVNLLNDHTLGKNGIEKHLVDLAKHKEKSFISTLIYDNKSEIKIFFMTLDCYLIEMKDNSYMLNRWIYLKSPKGICLTLMDENIVCGLGDGIIRIFNAKTLQHVSTLQRPPALGQANVEPTNVNKKINNNDLFPDVIALLYNKFYNKLISVFSDKTFFSWDITNNNLITRFNMNHSGSINCLDYFINKKQNLLAIATASDDKTVIYYNIKLSDFIKNETENKHPHIAYSHIIRQIFYFGTNFKHLTVKESDLLQKDKNEEDELNNNFSTDEVSNLTAIRFSPDNNYLTVGDDIGNITVFSLKTFKIVQNIPAHNGSVTALDMIDDKEKNKSYLVTGGSDCLIVLIDISKGLEGDFDLYDSNNFMEQLDTPIVSALFVIDKNNKIKLITAESNSTITFYLVGNNTLQSIQKIYGTKDKNNLKTYCLHYCPIINKVISGHNGQITIWKTSSCIAHKHFQVNKGDKALDNFRIACDSKGIMLATSNNDKIIRIRALHDGQLLSKIPTAESISSLSFVMDDNYLLATSVEGYVYFYKLNQEFINKLSKDQNLVNSTEERAIINNKLKLLQKFMENDNSLSKNEQVKFLIEKFQKSEETTLDDLKMLDGFVKEGKKTQKTDDKDKEKPKKNPLNYNLKEDKPNNNDDVENDNNENDNNKNDVSKNLNKSIFFEKGLKENESSNLLKKSLANNCRISLMDTYNKKKQGGDEKIKIPKIKVNEKKENQLTESKINNLKDIINNANQHINEKIDNINSLNKENKNETLNINDIKLNDNNNNEENKNEKEYSLENNENKKFSNLNITDEYKKNTINNDNEIKEEIQSSSNNLKLMGNDKISFAEKIITNSQNQVSNSMVDMTNTNCDIISNFDNQSQINKENEKEKVIEYLVTTTNFRIDGKKKENKNKIEKLDDINIKQKEIKAKDKLIENINKINLNELKNYELNELEKKVENLLDEIRVKTGNNSKDPTMEKLLEKYSVLLVDRINKKINK